MRDGTIKNLIVNNMQKIYTVCHQENSVTMRQVIELKIKLDTFVEIILSRGKLLKILWLALFSKVAALDYYNKLYSKNLDEMRAAAKKIIATEEQKEAQCSGSENKKETPKEDSSKEIRPTDEKPNQSK